MGLVNTTHLPSTLAHTLRAFLSFKHDLGFERETRLAGAKRAVPRPPTAWEQVSARGEGPWWVWHLHSPSNHSLNPKRTVPECSKSLAPLLRRDKIPAAAEAWVPNPDSSAQGCAPQGHSSKGCAPQGHSSRQILRFFCLCAFFRALRATLAASLKTSSTFSRNLAEHSR